MVISPFGPGLWRVLGNGEDKTLSYPFHLWEGEAFIMKNGNSLVLTKRVLTIIFHKKPLSRHRCYDMAQDLGKSFTFETDRKKVKLSLSSVAGLYA